MGNILTLVKWHLFPHPTSFTLDHIPDLSGCVVIVTGGNVGIGKETIRALLKRNAKVYMASRNPQKAHDTIQELFQDTGRQALFLHLDLASMTSVKNAAHDFLSTESELHILFNNAGVMWPPLHQVSEDGYDLQFATNVLGHVLLTELLMPALKAAVKSSPDGYARVITTSSGGAMLDTVNFDTLKDGPARRKKIVEELYHQSKFLNVVVARETAKRYAGDGIFSASVNPGNISTELLRYKPMWFHRLAAALVLFPPPQGALTQLWAGTMPEALQYNGEYLIPWAHVGRCREEAYDPVLGERVWSYLQAQVEELR